MTASALPDLPLTLHLPALRDTLLATVALLDRRRAGEVRAQLLDDYVRMRWLEWNGGTLRLTEMGKAICRQLTDRLES
jgi:hypothetical protein